MINRIIYFFLHHKLVTVLLTIGLIAWGLAVAPFDIAPDFLPRDRVAVDAIPNLGENQQIIYTEWPGRSPQDIDDQITYPLSTALLGIPGVKSIRSSSIFGASTIYLIFEEDIEFYWSRSRILEKLSSLPPGTLPDNVNPSLGPDATALGQVYWYTLEGRNPETGAPTGGWDPQELRSIQDFYVRYGLSTTPGVAEVAGIGGFEKEYQIELDPEKLRVYNVTISEVMQAVRKSNQEVGARTLEYNRAEYLIRGLGYISSIEDLEKSAVKASGYTPVLLGDIAHITTGPAPRRGGLDKMGQEAVGGVVVARHGSNPMNVIEELKEKIEEIEPGLPSKTLEDGTVSKVNIVPFYDRSGLIQETLGTLEEALSLQVLISIIVILLLVLNIRASVLISGLLPFGVLITFIAMKLFDVTANIVALSGIAIAIGVMIDIGVIITENIVQHLKSPNGRSIKKIVYEATAEVSSAVLTALATTVISFLPVFTLQYEEGKLFHPLAFTKTFALIAAMIIGLIVIPAAAHFLFSLKAGKNTARRAWNVLLGLVGIALIFYITWVGVLLLTLSIVNLVKPSVPQRFAYLYDFLSPLIIAGTVAFLLAEIWLPLGADTSISGNTIFVLLVIASIIGSMMVLIWFYEDILRFFLAYKTLFLIFIASILIFGLMSWRGFGAIFGFVADSSEKIGINLRETSLWEAANERFPALGEEFMPPLDEGSFLLMPTTMPHSGIEENLEVIRQLDQRIYNIPEVEGVVGKWGRVNSALDPAPISMFENIINYKPEYKVDENGRRTRFKVDEEEEFVKDENGELIPDPDGQYYRNWREHIQSPDDIWHEIQQATNLTGLTSAPKLQPIQTRQVMLSTGMRASMGIKLSGPDLATLEEASMDFERVLKGVSSIQSSSVFADRVTGKPYLEIDIDREAIARYGLGVADVHQTIQTALGGMPLSTTVEGRERYDIRIRYARDFRESPEQIGRLLIDAPGGARVPLEELADITYRRGPSMIKSEETFLSAYIIFDPKEGVAEASAVQDARSHIEEQIEKANLEIPKGVSYKFAGNYENQVRAEKRLMIVIPISLALIFLLLYFQFKEVSLALMAFMGIAVAFSGGFIMIWLYGQGWFLDFSIAGNNFREVFQISEIKLSVAIWVGFISLFGIATDDGVLMGTFLKQSFRNQQPTTKAEVRDAVVTAGKKRIRPAMITTATAIIALLPVLSSTGKGSDIMVPMAIPTFGGMLLQILTVFTVPVLFALMKENTISKNTKDMNKNNTWLSSLMKKWLPVVLVLITGTTLAQPTLNEYKELAAQNNPGLKSTFKSYHAALEQTEQVSALPDPTLMFGFFITPVETRVGPQFGRLSYTQMFPWFGTLSAKEAVAASRAQAAYHAFVSDRNKLYYDVEKTWNEMYILGQSIDLMKQNISFVKSFRQVAEARSSSGSASMVDVLRAEMEINVLEEKLQALYDRKKPLKTRFHSLVSDTSALSLPDTIHLDTLNAEKFLSLRDSMHAQNPGLQKIRSQQEAWQQEEKVSKKMSYPEISAGLDYIITRPRTDMEMPDNGQNAIMPRIGVSIPLYQKKYKAMQQQASFMQEAMENQYSDQQQKLNTGLEEAIQEYRKASREIELYRAQSKLARQALDIMTATYTTGEQDFEELLRMERKLLDFQLELISAQAKRNNTIAKISMLTGATNRAH